MWLLIAWKILTHSLLSFHYLPNTLPGADMVGRGLKELKEANVVYTCDKSKHAYKFNKAEKLNQRFR